MPAPQTCQEFLDVLREAGIVEEEALSPFLQKWNASVPVSNDMRLLADSLFQAGLLSPFQKEQLLEGKRRGYIIANKYVLLKHLGAGGMGSVWLCEHRVMRRRVAIKVLPSAFAKDPEYVARFHREARAAAALDHPNIVRAFDVDRDDRMQFLVMEFVDGQSLQELVDQKGPLEVRQAADYIAQAATGLQHAHEAGLVHRDIKPGNLLVDRKGVVKVLDMGLALFFQDQGKSLTQQYDANAVLGTAEYLAPEQAMNSHGVDIRADIYSLGMTLYFLLTAKSPYGDEGSIAQKLLWHQLRTPKSIRELRPEVPEGLAAIINKMLAKDPADRYQIPTELAKALTPWAKGIPEPEPALQPIPGPAKRVPETVRASDADTAVKSPKQGEPTVRAAKSRPETPTRTKPGKSGKIVVDADDRGRSKSKESPSALKRRKKEAEAATGFWTTSRIVVAAFSSGIVVLSAIAAIILSSMGLLSDSPRPTKPVVQQPSPGQKDNPPRKIDLVKTPPPPIVKIIEKKPPPKQEPPKTDPTKKTDPPKKEDAPKQDPKPPPTVAKESLIDFFPKTGTSLTYDMANYTGKSKVVVQQKWDFGDGVINVSGLKVGVLEGDSLLKSGKVKWNKQPLLAKEQAFFRTGAAHIEVGQVSPLGTILWEPILPVAASPNETWNWKLPGGDVKDYSVLKFDSYKGKRAVIVQESSPVQGGKLVTIHTYVQGLGEVSRSQSLEKTGAPPQLLGEAKLVD